MFIVTHTERKEDKEKNIEAVAAGVIYVDREAAEKFVAEGVADERTVVCTCKHYVKEDGVTCAYRERQSITNVDHALRALAMGKAVVEPSLGDNAEISDVFVAGKKVELSMFKPKSVKKKASKPNSPATGANPFGKTDPEKAA